MKDTPKVSIGKRVAWSIVFVTVYFVLTSIWAPFAASVEASAAVRQVDDSIVTYSFAQQMARGNVVPTILMVFLGLALFLMWLKPLRLALRKKQRSSVHPAHRCHDGTLGLSGTGESFAARTGRTE